MSNIDKMLEITSANQDLFVDLDDKSAEIISGGLESFTITNTFNRSIIYSIDGAQYTQDAKSTLRWVTTGKGEIKFDSSFAPGYQGKTWNLRDGSINEFRYDTSTWWDSADFDIYRIV